MTSLDKAPSVHGIDPLVSLLHKDNAFKHRQAAASLWSGSRTRDRARARARVRERTACQALHRQGRDHYSRLWHCTTDCTMS